MRGLLWFLCMVAVLMWTGLAVAGDKAAVVQKDVKAVQKAPLQKEVGPVQKTAVQKSDAVQKDGSVQKACNTRATVVTVRERGRLLRPFRLLCFRACRACK